MQAFLAVAMGTGFGCYCLFVHMLRTSLVTFPVAFIYTVLEVALVIVLVFPFTMLSVY